MEFDGLGSVRYKSSRWPAPLKEDRVMKFPRPRALAISLLALVALWGARYASAGDARASNESEAEKAVLEANQRFYDGLNKMFTGDVGPVLEVWAHTPDVTHMGPFGNRSVGWEQVREEFEKEAKLKMGGKVEPRDVIVHTDGDLAYAVLIEHGENLSPSGKAVKIELRATSIFRREGGQWKLVHHQADLSPSLKKGAKM
jgi:ketosteroid isomerase-like protein